MKASFVISIFIATLLIVNSTFAFAAPGAAPPSEAFRKDSLMTEYLEKTGVRQILLERREIGRKSTIELLNKFVDRIKSENPDFPDEVAMKMIDLIGKLADSMVDTYSIDEAVAVYAEPFERNYSSKMLKKKILELSTPENVRAMKIENEALMRMSEFVLQRETEAAEKLMNVLLAKTKETMTSPKQGRKAN
jgi:hypothetical protein